MIFRSVGKNLNRQAIKSKLLNDPYCRLESVTEIEVAAELGLRIDVNRACVDEWLRLPGISIHQARSLVDLIDLGLEILSLEDLASALNIPLERIKYWQPVLNFAYYHPESLITPARVNPNTASVEQLTAIPIIDSNLATLIVENRTMNAPYRNLADLQRRLGLTSQAISTLMHHFKF